MTRAILCAACLWIAGLSPAGAQAAQDVEQTLARVATELDALNHGVAPGSVARRIQALGAPAARAILEALARGELVLAGAPLPLGERERQSLLEAARNLGRAPFGPLWSEAASQDERRRQVTIELIGTLGGASDLVLAVQAATPAGEERPAAETLDALQHAAEELLRRDPGTLNSVQATLARAPAGIADRLIEAVGSLGEERALRALGALLGAEERMDLPLLSQIAVVARKRVPPFDEALCRHVRRYLDARDRQLARGAAMALAELQDPEAVPDLLRLASSLDASLSGAAYVALERTTELQLPHRVERWQSWLAAELEWNRQRGAELQAALRGPEPAHAVTALREIAPHRLERVRLAGLVADCLAHTDERVRAEACRTLAALRSPQAASQLREAREDGSSLVADAAEAALRSLGVTP